MWTWLLLPVLVLALLVITVAVAMLLSALYPRFRDVALIWSVLSTVLFYATPILYPISVGTRRQFQHVVQLNPLTPIFEQAQKWIIDPNAPGAIGATERLRVPADRLARHLRRHLRARGVGLQSRSAADRRGALSRGGRAASGRRPGWTWSSSPTARASCCAPASTRCGRIPPIGADEGHRRRQRVRRRHRRDGRRANTPRSSWSRPASNLGFAAATNLGIRAGEAPYVLALNPDTRVTRARWTACSPCSTSIPRWRRRSPPGPRGRQFRPRREALLPDPAQRPRALQRASAGAPGAPGRLAGVPGARGRIRARSTLSTAPSC